MNQVKEEWAWGRGRGAGAGVFAGCQQGAKPEGCFEDYGAGLEVPGGRGLEAG